MPKDLAENVTFALIHRRPPPFGYPSAGASYRTHFFMTERQKTWLLTQLRRLIMFKECDNDKLEEVVEAFTAHISLSGEVIHEEGGFVNRLMIVQKGWFYDYSSSAGQLKFYHDKGCFGQYSLVHDKPSPSKLVSLTGGIIWYINKRVYRDIILKYETSEKSFTFDLLTSIPIFSDLNKSQEVILYDAIKNVTIVVKDGSCVKEPGHKIDGIYILEEGVITLVSLDEGITPVHLKCGDYFGKYSTNNIKHIKMGAYAVGDVKLKFGNTPEGSVKN